MSADVAARAIEVLEANWSGSHTLPATGLYPHQWSWDSGFIAMGLRHISPRRAGQEMDALLAGQWTDGRIPQIIFDPHRDSDYSPGSSFWQSRSISGSPDVVETAGLIQPPNHAWAIWKVHQADPDESARRTFLARAYPRLLHWHEYLRTRRDRGGRGLASIVHPWEAGTDNSPLWDESLARVSDAPQHTFDRPDLLHADPSERPSNREYGRYFWLAERYRDFGCDDTDPDYPFLFEDPLFNTLYVVSELALARIAIELGKDPGPHEARARELSHAIEALFVDAVDDPASMGGFYAARDVVTDRLVKKATINGVLPLLIPGIGTAAHLIATLEGPRFLGSGALLPPSYDATAADLNPELYWRGPAWFNMAWLAATALASHGRLATAEEIGGRLVRIADVNHYPEYVEPWKGTPHGTQRFSWTASLVLETLSHQGWGLFE